jgi:hypothetical protein
MPFRLIDWTFHYLLTLGGVDRFRIPGDSSSGPLDFNNDADPQTAGTALSSVVTHKAKTFLVPGLSYLDATATTTTGGSVATIAAGAAGDTLLSSAAPGDVLFSSRAGARKNRFAGLITSVDVAARRITIDVPLTVGGTGTVRLGRTRFDAAAVASAAATAAASNPRIRLDFEYHLFLASSSSEALVQRVGRMLLDVYQAIKAGAPTCEVGLYLPTILDVVDLYFGFANPSTDAGLRAGMRADNEVFARAGVFRACDVLVPDLYPAYNASELAQYGLGELPAWRLEAEFTLAECRRLAPGVPVMPAVRTQYFAFSASVNDPVPQAMWQGMVMYLYDNCPGMHVWGQTNIFGGAEFPANYTQDLAKRSPSWVADLNTLKTGRW